MANHRKLSIIRHDMLGTGGGNEEGILLNEVYYNEQGHETERLNYNTDGEVEEHIVVDMKEGKPVEERLEINGEITERTTREFDEKGRIVSETRHYAEGGIDIITYEYDGEHLIQRTVKDEDGEEGEKEVHEYENGKIVKEAQYDLFGNPEMEKVYEYDENGNLEQVTEVSFRTDRSEKTVQVFDETGRMTTEKKYDSKDRLIARTTIQYHENNLPMLFEEESTRGRKTTILEYDEAGNNTRQEETDGDGKRISLIERTYTETGHPLTAEVIMEPSLYSSGQHYRLEYQYS